MRNVLILALFLFVGSIAMTGCGKKSDSEEGKVPAEVKEAEAKDSTRLDSADHGMMEHEDMSHEHMSHDSM